MDFNEKPLLEKSMSYALDSVEEAEIMIHENISTPVGFEAEKLKEIETRETWGLGVRIIKNGRIGISSTSNPDQFMTAIDRAIELSEYGPKAHFKLPSKTTYEEVKTYDPQIETILLEQMADYGREIIAKVKPISKETLFDAGIQKSLSTFALLNSNDVFFSSNKSSFSSWLSGTLIRGTDMLFVSESFRGNSPKWDVHSLISEIERQLSWGEAIVDSPSGKLPVLFLPRAVVSVLLSPFMSGINGKSVLHGSSPLGDKLETKIFDDRITIHDNPMLDLKPPSRFADDEGIKTKDRYLVENGTLKTILYDLQTAGQSGKQSTGNASRGLGSMPGVSNSYITISPGNASFEMLLTELQNGIIVEQLIGMGQGNTLGGDAGGNILLGYRVKDGKVVGRIKDTMLNCNIYDALSNIIAIGSNSKELGGSMSIPAILCKDISVSPKINQEK
jgi:PmbA protein